MSNTKLIKIAAALFAAGIILFFVGNLFGGRGIFINSRFQIGTADDTEYFEYENRNLQAFTGVNINVGNMPVEFLPSEDGLYGVKAAYYATDKENMLIEVKDNILKVEQKSEMRFISFDLSFLSETNKEYVIVYLPKQEYETINASTSNGMISMEGTGTVVENLILDTSNGPIRASDITAGTFTADTSNGTVNLNGIASENVRVKTSNAPVTVSDCVVSVLEIRTSNGTVNLEGMDFDGSERDISVDTSNAAITAGFEKYRESDFRIKANTSNANVYVNDENLRAHDYTTKDGDGRLRLKTSNGRIEMYFGFD